jgi:hypothetical protein
MTTLEELSVSHTHEAIEYLDQVQRHLTVVSKTLNKENKALV